MRNLQLLKRVAVWEGLDIPEAVCIAVTVDSGIAFVATVTEIVALKSQTGELVSKVSIPVDAQTGGESTPVSLEYVFDQHAVCLITRDGKFLLWQYEMNAELEDVGEVTNGVTAVSWSPDFELVIVTTGDKRLLMMTSEFDIITETTLIPDQQGEDSNVAVGWGGRFIYTWSRECIFQARSEAVDGLQHSLSWKPSGSLIASVQSMQHAGSQQIVFFEKNGLRHGQFTIPSVSEKDLFVKQIMWNQDSTILMLHIDEYDGISKLDVSYIQLWTVNNYHWYLKQSLRFDSGVATARWDPENAHALYVATRGGQLVTYIWSWTTDHTRGAAAQDQSLVAVIDGSNILVTPMRLMLVPPPMAASTLVCPSPVNRVAFGPCPGSNDMIAYLSTGKMALFYSNDEGCTSEVSSDPQDEFKHIWKEPVLKGILDIKFFPEVKAVRATDLRHMLWVSKENIIMVAQGKSFSASVLLLGTIKLEESRIDFEGSVEMSSVILSLAFNQDTKNVAVELDDGTVLKYVPASKALTPWVNTQGRAVSFPSPCTQIALTCVGSEEVVLGLTERFRFFVHGIEIASNCTSFGVHNDFLLLTTLSHTLRCLPKSTKHTDLPKLSAEKTHPFDESCRRVERGSRIVTVVGDCTKVVLQMPRGNLETIHPRALLTSSLKKLMDGNNILEAFMTIRRHRINMNLLYDHNPKRFLERVDDFIKTINKQSYLNVFLTDLIEEDVTKTMYSASYSQEQKPHTSAQTQKVSKVDKICDAFLAAFQRLGVNQYIQSVLTAYARKTVPELEKALQLVWSLHGQEENSAEAALNYLLFVIDVNTLYDVALGTYNFDLVMMVAQKSQKDPKEYIPFLNQLRRLEENYRYYTIDKHLKKYSKALGHISKCGDEHFEECVGLVSEHNLHRQALLLYKPGSAQFKRLAILYGDYLWTKNRHEEAGIEYIKAEEWHQALEAFRRACDWQQVFCMAYRQDYSKSQLYELAVKVAGDLKSRQKYEDASTVLIDYAEDHEEAIVALVEGSHWKKALRQIHRFKRLDLIDTHLLPALKDSLEHHTVMLSSQRELFERYQDRLLVVRALKEKAAADLLESAATDYNDAEADLISDATSVTGASLPSTHSSRSTVFTKGTGSARTRRKAENKKWSLKEGSINEEFALVDALAKIIKAVDGLKEDINVLLKMLVQFNYDESAQDLQGYYNELLQMFQSAIPEIWVYSRNSSISGMSLGPNSTANAVAQALQKGHTLQSEEEQLDPVLLVPPTLDKDVHWKLHIATASDQNR
ncbi:elongator complex protein 1 [Elysia marginata]|uniref:Elongator complex protein 1 n=1 Tax=Elysia marginata TaxID=1093978 RepID=A0AAV4GMA8_9GAST|nr:elongator complex protein 1 [Elysia marginata]